MTTLAEKASGLLDLHRAAEPLILINAWDAASARIIEQAGFPAIATTSAGVANAVGYADGQHLPWSDMVDAIRQITRAVRVPVTADIEAGFSDRLEDLQQAVVQMREAPAARLNFDDARPPLGTPVPLHPLPAPITPIHPATQ